MAIQVFCFIEETGFTRSDDRIYPRSSPKFLRNRIETFFPGTKVIPKATWPDVVSLCSFEVLLRYILGQAADT